MASFLLFSEETASLVIPVFIQTIHQENLTAIKCWMFEEKILNNAVRSFAEGLKVIVASA